MGHQAASRDGTPAEQSTTVVEAVARRVGSDPLDLPPLFEAVDTDALDALVANSTGPIEVTFEYQGYTVTVQGDGRVDVES